MPVQAGAPAARRVTFAAAASGSARSRLAPIASLAEGRELVARSFPLEEFLPVAEPRWQDAYGRFRALLGEAPPPHANLTADRIAINTGG